MRRWTSAWLLLTLWLSGCGGGEPPALEETKSAPAGRACIGEVYAFWSGEEALAKAEACSEPVVGAVVRITMPDGQVVATSSDAQGRFLLGGLDLEQAGATIFVDGPLGVGGMELADAPGPSRLLRPDFGMLFVTLPRAACEPLGSN